MRDGIAADVRAMVAGLDKSDLWVQRSPLSRTGYTNVIKVKGGKYQARLQVKGDGRGGVRKRKQYSLPGVFDTALEAAYYLAWVVKHGTENWENGIPAHCLASTAHVPVAAHDSKKAAMARSCTGMTKHP